MNITINNGIIRIEFPFSELVAIATTAAKATATHQTQKIASAIRHTKRTTRTLKSSTGPALQQAILIALSGEQWMKAEALKKRMKGATRDGFIGARDALLKAGKLERRGEKRATEYRLRGTLSNRVAKKSAKKPTARQGATAR